MSVCITLIQLALNNNMIKVKESTMKVLEHHYQDRTNYGGERYWLRNQGLYLRREYQ